MEKLVHKIEYPSRADVFTIYAVGDLHIGASACNEERIRSLVRTIKLDPVHNIWVGIGDLAELINKQDSRHRQSRMAKWLRCLEDTECIDDIVGAQEDRVVDILSPIVGQCLGLVRGNHENKLLERWERNFQGRVCSRLRVPNFGTEVLIKLLFSRGGQGGSTTSLNIYAHHGWFTGRKSGSKVNNLHDIFLSYPQADVVFVGHGHERVVAPPLAAVVLSQAGEIVQYNRYAIMTGSFLMTHVEGVESYADDKGFRPTSPGAGFVKFQPSTRAIWTVV